MSYPQNVNHSAEQTLGCRTALGSVIEENSKIRLVKPYPPSTDNTTDASCVSCADPGSNYCRRLLQEVLEKNPHLVICLKAVDGWWSDWTAGPCRAVRQLPPGSPCGNGWLIKTRKCRGRKFGGKFCEGKASSHEECLDQECPGKHWMKCTPFQISDEAIMTC